MTSYAWATPRKVDEYYLQGHGRTPADLWQAVYDGHVRILVMGVEFSGDQARALVQLLHFNVPENEQEFELPIWMAVNVDDVERTLCGVQRPPKAKGRPRKSSAAALRDRWLAIQAARLISDGTAGSVEDAARLLINSGQVPGASDEAKKKAVRRAYEKHFRSH